MAQNQRAFDRFVRAFFKDEDMTPSGEWKNQKEFCIPKDEKKRQGYSQNRFIVDGYSERLKIVWEYDGPYHYILPRTISKDNDRKNSLPQEKIFH